jgi:hypothetical protein
MIRQSTVFTHAITVLRERTRESEGVHSSACVSAHGVLGSRGGHVTVTLRDLRENLGVVSSPHGAGGIWRRATESAMPCAEARERTPAVAGARSSPSVHADNSDIMHSSWDKWVLFITRRRERSKKRAMSKWLATPRAAERDLAENSESADLMLFGALTLSFEFGGPRPGR